VSGEALNFDNIPFSVSAQIEARASHPLLENKAFLLHGERSWTYRQFRDESVRTALFLRNRLGAIDEGRPPHVAMMLENHLELCALFGGSAYAGATLFGLNTGLRGEVLAGVLNHSRARVLVVGERFLPEIDRIRGKLDNMALENIVVLPNQAGEGDLGDYASFLDALSSEVAAPGTSLDAPEPAVDPDTNLMVIYTSGTTGLPKGINNNHMKFTATGFFVAGALGLTSDDVAYTCMPLFHSNSLFIGFMPAFWVGGSIGIAERFSASKFADDVMHYGVTYWNYVGEPVHYVLGALEKKYGGEERILAEVARNPRNHLRYAVGNGAAPPDIDQFARYFALEDMFELYGSTEAAISTFRRLGDPRGSCGAITDPQVKILNEQNEECPPATLSAEGKITNYAEAVGEICRVAADTALFQGYFDNPEANASKYRDGVYHSGDLGHVLIEGETRFLFFDGRNDDWIRKDGENFSAAQVGRLLGEHPDVALAAAYGVPCPVSDEFVMAALKLRDGAVFDPKEFFDFCEREVSGGSMDRKWFPDYLRIVDEFEYTGTQKILVRNLKAVHFDRNRLGDATLYWRRRGDDSFRPFTSEDYRHVRTEFEKSERLELLDR